MAQQKTLKLHKTILATNEHAVTASQIVAWVAELDAARRDRLHADKLATRTRARQIDVSATESALFVSSEAPGGINGSTQRLGRRGILPQIVENLLDERRRTKKLMKQESDPKKKSVLNGRQLALKVSANSVYGFTAAQKYPGRIIAKAICAYGRRLLRYTQFYASVDWPNVFVAYGDTDSVFVCIDAPPAVAEQTAHAIAAQVNEAQQVSMLEFEKIYQSWLLASPKRYVGMKQDSLQCDPKLDCKGLMMVRRDFVPVARTCMADVVKAVLEHGDVRRAMQPLLQTGDKMARNDVDLEDMVCTRSLKKSYANPNLPHVAVVAKMAARAPGTEPKPGSRVRFVVVCTTGGHKAKLFEKAEDPEYAVKHSVPLDLCYIFEAQMFKPVFDLLDFLQPGVIAALFEDVRSRLRADTDRKVAQVSGNASLLKYFSVPKNKAASAVIGAMPSAPRVKRQKVQDGSNQKKMSDFFLKKT